MHLCCRGFPGRSLVAASASAPELSRCRARLKGKCARERPKEHLHEHERSQARTSKQRPGAGAGGGPALARLRACFASDTRRTIQTVLGLIWLLDGLLQFQSFMYSKGFPRCWRGWSPASRTGSRRAWLGRAPRQRQPGRLEHAVRADPGAIGLGLLYRPTVKLALAGSFAWVMVVWWFGEAFGMLFMNTANP